MADLITSDRAKQNIGQASFSPAEDTTIASLVSACSKAIEKYCRREFVSAPFDELYDGTQVNELLLRHFPILSIARVAYGPTGVLRIINTAAANQRATVAVTATGLCLVRVASGVVTADTSITFAGNPTLAQVAAAVTALGNGWSATVPDPNYANWASADLRAVQGAVTCRNLAVDLLIHVSELTSYDMDAFTGTLYRSPTFDPLWIFPYEQPTWIGGRNYWRVIYTAGYATVPDDVQEACAQWVAVLFWLTKRDATIANSFAPVTGGSQGTAYAITLFEQIPGGVKTLIEPYKKHRV
jgi:hypothetical protein